MPLMAAITGAVCVRVFHSLHYTTLLMKNCSYIIMHDPPIIYSYLHVFQSLTAGSRTLNDTTPTSMCASASSCSFSTGPAWQWQMERNDGIVAAFGRARPRGRWKPIEHERRRGFEEEAGVVGQPAWGIGGKDGDGRVQASDRWLLHETRAGLGVCRRQPRQRWWCWLLFRTSPLAQGDPSML